MTDFSKLISKDFKETVKTWKDKNKPTFNPQVRQTKNTFSAEVSTGAKIYRFVSGGTKRHPIPKKFPAKILRFKGGYEAKTEPGRISSRSGGPFGPWVSKKSVMHPGIKARKFDEQIKEFREKSFEQLMLAALLDVMEES